MPTAYLKFKLPEESIEFEEASNAGKYASFIHELYNYLRSLNKYDERVSIPKEELTEHIYSLMEDLPNH